MTESALSSFLPFTPICQLSSKDGAKTSLVTHPVSQVPARLRPAQLPGPDAIRPTELPGLCYRSAIHL